jgi:hypothetical protein
MTAAGLRRPVGSPDAEAVPAAGPVVASLRLSWLYLASRRAPAAVGLLAALGAVLWAALHWHWSIVGGAAARVVVFLVIETGAAAVIAVTTYGPFGEPERATGRWLPYLRLGAAVLLTAAAVGALAAGATGGQLPGGTEAMVRNLAGMTGTGLLVGAALGGSFGWAGPMAYLLVTEGALAGAWTTPWIWPARPSNDLGGALCAYAVFAAGLAALTLLGPRDASRTQPRE